MNESKRIYPQICQHVTVDCDSSMLSMENITWADVVCSKGWRRGKAVVVDSDWLIWLVRWLKGLWTVELSQITWWGFAAITSGGSIRKYGSLTSFSFWWTLDTTPTPNPPLTDPTIAHTHIHADARRFTRVSRQTHKIQAHVHHILHRHTNKHRFVNLHTFTTHAAHTHPRARTSIHPNTHSVPTLRLAMCYCDDAECGGRWRIRQRKTGDAKMNIYNDCCCCRKIRILKKRPHIY